MDPGMGDQADLSSEGRRVYNRDDVRISTIRDETNRAF